MAGGNSRGVLDASAPGTRAARQGSKPTRGNCEQPRQAEVGSARLLSQLGSRADVGQGKRIWKHRLSAEPTTSPPAVLDRGEIEAATRADRRYRRAAHWRTAAKRAALLRRGLATADAIAVLISLLAIAAVSDAVRVRWPALLIPPLFIVIAKVLGLYDRDEHRLHKTTVDEVPTLFGLATVTVLVHLARRGRGASAVSSTRSRSLALWALDLRALAHRFGPTPGPLATAPSRRSGASSSATRRTPSFSRGQIELSPSVRANVVGVLPAARRQRPKPSAWRFPAGHRDGSSSSEHVDRVIVARPARGARGRREPAAARCASSAPTA